MKPRSAVKWLACLLLLLPLVRADSYGQEAPDITATFTPDTTTIFAGQQFVLTLAVRSRGVRLGKDFELTGLPAEPGLEIAGFRELPTKREATPEGTVELRRFRCEAVAPAPGTLRLSPMLSFSTVARERTLFGTSWVTSRRQLRVAPHVLTVSALPVDGRPANFSGGIGRFQLSVEVTPREIAVGDLLTLTMRIRGDGDLDRIEPPALEGRRHLKVYPAKATRNATRGELLVEQTLIPQSTNLTALPRIQLCYFDPVSADYVTVESPPLELQYRARTAPTAGGAYTPDPELRSSGESAPLVSGGSALRATSSPWTLAALVAAVVALLALVRTMSGLHGRRVAKRKGLPVRLGGTLVALALAVLSALIAIRLQLQSTADAPDARTRVAVTLRIAPAGAARPVGELETGEPVRRTEVWEDWVRIASDQGTGWVPAGQIE